MGLPRIALKLALRLLGVVTGFVLLPVTLVLHVAGYRRVTVFADRIGHLAIEPDCLIKQQTMGQLPNCRWVLLAPSSRVANQHLLDYWAPWFLVLRHPVACFLVSSATQWGLARFDIGHYMRAIGRTQAAFQIERDWGEREPLLHLSEADRHWGEAMLQHLGVPVGAWFVCVHARGGGFSPVDEELQHHRNSDIKNMIPAMQEIVRRGGWVVRLGDGSMERLPPLPQVIDYAHHPLKSARLDVVLCAMARCVVGNSSGIALVGTVFGVPAALTNMAPMTAMGFGPADLSIPKLHWSNAEGRYLRVSEVLASGIASAQYPRQFAKAGVRLDENDAEDICDLACEMLDRIDGLPGTDARGLALQQTFGAMLAPGHYSFGTAAQPGARFLLRHGELLEG